MKTSSGATAVQIVYSSHRGSREIEHLGSAHDDAGVELLKTAARQKLAAGQGMLDLGLDAGAPGGPLPIISARMGCLVNSLSRGYELLGLAAATRGDEVFGQLVLARIIEPVSKLDSLRVLGEAGVPPVPYRTVTRRLRAFAEDSWRQQISAACAAHAGLCPASLVLQDATARSGEGRKKSAGAFCRGGGTFGGTQVVLSGRCTPEPAGGAVNAEANDFARFVETREGVLRRSAWLLTGDWGLAEDLVQTALARAWPRWERIRRRDNPEVYVRRVMVNTWLTWSRRRWRGEKASRAVPDARHRGTWRRRWPRAWPYRMR